MTECVDCGDALWASWDDGLATLAVFIVRIKKNHFHLLLAQGIWPRFAVKDDQ